MNRACLSGNLTKAPTLKSTASGVEALEFRLCFDTRVKTDDGWESRPNYIRCTVFGARAKALERYLDKGSKVAVEGRLRYSEWEAEGQRRSMIDLVVDDLEFMSRQDGAKRDAPDLSPYEDDIPF